MQVIATNIAKPTIITFNSKEVTTGIYKTPTTEPIFLGKDTVKNDEVTDRKHHGGEFKACYLFSENQYPYWQNLYPNLKWDFGMFGENVTISNLDESKILVGDIYKLGSALVQITQPREPCFKFGVKFGDQNILSQFIKHGFSGTYVRVLEEGFVKTGDHFELIEKAKNSITIFQLFELLFSKNKNQQHLKLAVELDALPLYKRQQLTEYIK